VRAEFGSAAPLILDGGESQVGLESTIISLVDEPLLLRPGAITQAEIEAVIGPVRRAARGEGPRAPGTTRAHYAPRTPLVIAGGQSFADAASGEGVAVLALDGQPAGFRGRLWVESGRAPDRYAHDLYAQLRRLDESGATQIIVEAVPDGPEWEAIRDRLGRAAAAAEPEDLA
jgi:L-threonylcarbamoyladenylate synthase